MQTEEQKVELLRKLWLVLGLAVFLVTASLAVAINATCYGHGWHTETSISRYVGYETWSAVIFALGNFVMAGVLLKCLWRLGGVWKMPRIYYYMSLVMVVSLIGLSMCPVGYFDVNGQRSTISVLHELCSRAMFLMMLMVAGMLVWKSVGSEKARLAAGIYFVYGVICLIGYLTKGKWFLSYLLIYETMYIAGFVMMLICQRERIAE